MKDTTLSDLSTLRAHRILAVSVTGDVTLEGTNARVLLSGRAAATDVGRLAVCQDIMVDNAAAVVVLGVIHDEQAQAQEAPLTLEHGDAALIMYADGRIVLRGEDIALDATAAVRLLGARIDLN